MVKVRVQSFEKCVFSFIFNLQCNRIYNIELCWHLATVCTQTIINGKWYEDLARILAYANFVYALFVFALFSCIQDLTRILTYSTLPLANIVWPFFWYLPFKCLCICFCHHYYEDLARILAYVTCSSQQISLCPFVFVFVT